jgi:hypothetical protein
MNCYASMLRRLAVSILRLRSTDSVAEAPAEPFSLTELLSILPGDCDTYHLPLTRGTPVHIDLVAESALEIVLVHYRDARASGHPCAYRHRAVAKATHFVFVCPQTGDYLLQFHNVSVASTSAIVSISSPLVVPAPSIPPPLDSAPVSGSLSDLSFPRWFQPRIEDEHG